MSGELPQETGHEAAQAFITETDVAAPEKATRVSSLATLEAFSPLLPELFGGSADLGGSNGTEWSGFKPMRAEMYDGQLHQLRCARVRHVGDHERYRVARWVYSIRRHLSWCFPTMRAMRLRMAALMKIQSIFVFTHDSIGLGEDGPTHQAVEQIPARCA